MLSIQEDLCSKGNASQKEGQIARRCWAASRHFSGIEARPEEKGPEGRPNVGNVGDVSEAVLEVWVGNAGEAAVFQQVGEHSAGNDRLVDAR